MGITMGREMYVGLLLWGGGRHAFAVHNLGDRGHRDRLCSRSSFVETQRLIERSQCSAHSLNILCEEGARCSSPFLLAHPGIWLNCASRTRDHLVVG